MNLKGTKTEKNLMEAFAGESQARNKYTYFASVAKKEGFQQISAIFEKPQTTKKNTQNFGLRHLANLEPQQKIFFTQQKARIMNGQICTTDLQKMQRKKALLHWQRSSEW